MYIKMFYLPILLAVSISLIIGCSNSNEMPKTENMSEDEAFLVSTAETVWHLVSVVENGTSSTEIDPSDYDLFTLQYVRDGDSELLQGNHICNGFSMAIVLANDVVSLGAADITDGICTRTHPLSAFVGSIIFSMESLMISGDHSELVLTTGELSSLTYRP